MGKHIIFSVVLNVLIISSALVGIYAYKLDNYFVPLLCVASFSLSLYYKFKHIKTVREEMKIRAEENIKKKSKKNK
ncbi:DUF6358 family protein [Pelobium sp.]|nr:DUF6358 family protein [Pelobium sp.]MDA9554715.1 DUF6358 family protein [Pelobium sp.]